MSPAFTLLSLIQLNTVMNTIKDRCFISILVVKVPQKTLLMDALKEETEIVYDFCMCNPPFFANQLEAKVRASLMIRVPLGASATLGARAEHEAPFVCAIVKSSLIGFGRNLCLSCCSHQGVNSRNSRRPPPSSVNTGGVTEIMAEGGELEFVKRIIHDSLQLKRRLRYAGGGARQDGYIIQTSFYLLAAFP